MSGLAFVPAYHHTTIISIGSQRGNPVTPTALDFRVFDRYRAVLAGYHPSRWPVGRIPDRTRTRTETPLTSPESISGLRVPRRGAQGGGGPPATGSSSRRSGAGPKNGEIVFLGGWYKLETPQPLSRHTQTGLGPSGRTPTDRGPYGFGKGVVSSDHRHGSWPLRTPSASTALG